MDLLQSIKQNKELSPKTIQNYTDYFSAIETRAKTEFYNVATNPDKYIPLFKTWFSKETTHKTMITAILGAFRYNPELKDTHSKEHAKWADVFKKAKDVVEERYSQNKPTERQEAGYVPYADIIKARDALPKGDLARLLLGVYTYIHPMRCEYSRVRIYKGRVPKEKEPNYIVLSAAGKARLILTHFKTRKHHAPYDILLPSELVEDLTASLKAQPRDYLFVNSRGEPYTSHLYTKWTMRVFQGIFKRPLTVALIRHAFVNTIDFNTLSIKEKREIATSMGHTVETQDRYRLLFDDAKSKCECVCESKV